MRPPTRINHRLFFRSFPVLVLFLFSGCIGNGPAVHEYTLYPAAQPIARQQDAILTGSIMLMPVVLPPANNTQEIILRSDLPSLTSSGTHLWAGSLQKQLTTVLAENIRRNKTVQTVLVYPGPRFAKPDMLVEVELTRFDGNMKTGFTCTALWAVSNRRQKKMLTYRKFSTVEPVASNDFTSYVTAASSSIAKLGEAISDYLGTIAKDEKKPI